MDYADFSVEALKLLLTENSPGSKLRSYYRHHAQRFSVEFAEHEYAKGYESVHSLVRLLPSIEIHWLEFIDRFFCENADSYIAQIAEAQGSREKVLQRELAWMANVFMLEVCRELRTIDPECWNLLMLRCSASYLSFSECFEAPFEGKRWENLCKGIEEVFTHFSRQGVQRDQIEGLLLAMQSPAVGAFGTSWRIESRSSKQKYVRHSWSELLRTHVVQFYKLRAQQYLPQRIAEEVSWAHLSEESLVEIELWEVLKRSETFYSTLASRLQRVLVEQDSEFVDCFYDSYGREILPQEIPHFQQAHFLQLLARLDKTDEEKTSGLRSQMLILENELVDTHYDLARNERLLVEAGAHTPKLLWEEEERKTFLQNCLSENSHALLRKQELEGIIAQMRRDYDAFGGAAVELNRCSYLLEDAGQEYIFDLSQQCDADTVNALYAYVTELLIKHAEVPDALLNPIEDEVLLSKIIRAERNTAIIYSRPNELSRYIHALATHCRLALRGLTEKIQHLSPVQRFRTELFFAEAVLLQVVSQVPLPSKLTEEPGAAQSWGVWLETVLAQRLIQIDSRFGLYLRMKKPSLFYYHTALEVLEAEQSEQGQDYLDGIVENFVSVWQNHYREADLVPLYNALRAYCRCPALDAHSESRVHYDLFAEKRFFLSFEQSLKIPTKLRRRLFEIYVREQLELFHGHQHTPGWISQALFFRLKKNSAYVWRKLYRTMIDHEYEKLMQERKSFMARRQRADAVVSINEAESDWLLRHEDLLASAALLMNEPMDAQEFLVE